MLIILGGFPGSGKTTLARELSQKIGATFIRIDTIEQTIRNKCKQIGEVIDEGYAIGSAIAKDNLNVGQYVVADSVNSIDITREMWVETAKQANSKFVEVEIICSDKSEHRNRVETRKADLPNHKLPDWQKVENRDYSAWDSKHVTIDTAGRSVEYSIKELVDKLRPLLQNRKNGGR